MHCHGLAGSACPRAGAQPECASRKKPTDSRERVFFIRPQALEATSKNALSYGDCTSGAIIYAYVNGNPLGNVDPDGLLFGATFNGGRRDMSLDRAAQIGALGNAAMVIGGVGSVGGATAAYGAYVYFGVLPGAARAAISVARGINGDAMPPPVPPKPQTLNPPNACGPANSSPPPQIPPWLKPPGSP